MSVSAVTVRQVRPRRHAALLGSVSSASEMSVKRRVCLTWGLLFLNVLTYAPGVAIVPLPSTIGKLITQGALPAALLVALSINRKLILRPNVLLCLVTLIIFGALMADLQGQPIGSLYRTVRLTEFVVALWLLTPWWGRKDFLLLRCHLVTMGIVLGSVLIGLIVDPGRALINGRLNGVIWPIAETQVAHYAAVMVGLVVVLWLCGKLRGRLTLAVVAVSVPILLLTHTRTALLALGAGLLVSGLSLIGAKARARRFFAMAAAVVVGVAITLSDVITAWLARGQSGSQLVGLTGRTTVWGLVLNAPRTGFQEVFGFGLSNASFNGLAIDSNWLASYMDQGLWGVAVCAAILLFLLILAFFQPRGTQRAVALFLVMYCLVASFTEVGFTDTSPYLLDVTVAASLLVPPILERSRRA
jgi:hypothetical protein